MTNEETNSTEKAPTQEQHITAALYEIRDILRTMNDNLAALRNDITTISKVQQGAKFYGGR